MSEARSPELYIVDILIASDKIYRYTHSFQTAQEFLHSELEWDAALRELEIVGEAVRHLIRFGLAEDKYRRIVDFRNLIAHAYFGIDEEIVWEVITKHLKLLAESVWKLGIENPHDFAVAIECAKEDFSHHPQTVNFLTRLEEQLQHN